LEENGIGLITVQIPRFSWKDWGKLRQFLIHIARISAENRTERLPNPSLKRYHSIKGTWGKEAHEISEDGPPTLGLDGGLTTPRKKKKSYRMLHRASDLAGFCWKIQATESTSKWSITLKKDHRFETSENRALIRKWKEPGEKYMSSILCTLRRILFRWSNQEWWEGQGMQYAL
jgi:hypothetical protein